MRSTGEVMGIDRFGPVFAKSQIAAGNRLPNSGVVFLSRSIAISESVCSRPARSPTLVHVRRHPGHRTIRSTPRACTANRWWRTVLIPGVVDGRRRRGRAKESGKVDLVVNTSMSGSRADGAHIRRTATARGIPCVTTVAAALAASAGIVEWSSEATVRSLQEYHRDGQLRLEV